jgi:hypothetical protein
LSSVTARAKTRALGSPVLPDPLPQLALRAAGVPQALLAHMGEESPADCTEGQPVPDGILQDGTGFLQADVTGSEQEGDLLLLLIELAQRNPGVFRKVRRGNGGLRIGLVHVSTPPWLSPSGRVYEQRARSVYGGPRWKILLCLRIRDPIRLQQPAKAALLQGKATLQQGTLLRNGEPYIATEKVALQQGRLSCNREPYIATGNVAMRQGCLQRHREAYIGPESVTSQQGRLFCNTEGLVATEKVELQQGASHCNRERYRALEKQGPGLGREWRRHGILPHDDYH